MESRCIKGRLILLYSRYGHVDLAKEADSLLVAKRALLRRLLSMKTASVASSVPYLAISAIHARIFSV